MVLSSVWWHTCFSEIAGVQKTIQWRSFPWKIWEERQQIFSNRLKVYHYYTYSLICCLKLKYLLHPKIKKTTNLFVEILCFHTEIHYQILLIFEFFKISQQLNWRFLKQVNCMMTKPDLLKLPFKSWRKKPWIIQFCKCIYSID